ITSENGPEFTIIDCQADQEHPARIFTFDSGEDESYTIDGLTLRGGYGPSFNGGSSGGAILLDGSSPQIINCIFGGNTATFGGAIYANQASPVLVNCTFVSNAATYGSAVFSYRNSMVALENCIAAFNGTGAAVMCLESSSASCVCTDIFGNTGGDWVGCLTGQESIDGNFSADPLFCSISVGLFGLRDETSPCL
ncbi:MAG: hypothetical protein GY869_31255, partial [Planctomycetes bacterium]|nr:hypothetical protein [Planctomycetota bacterium]